MRDIEDIMVELLDLKTIDGGLCSSVNVNNWTITLSVEDNEEGLACVSLYPADARQIGAFLIARADEVEARRAGFADAAEAMAEGDEIVATLAEHVLAGYERDVCQPPKNSYPVTVSGVTTWVEVVNRPDDDKDGGTQ